MRKDWVESFAPFRERDYRRVFLANTASHLGDQALPVVLAFAVLDVTDSATALGLVLLARTVPLVVFVLTGGVWADRLPRQRIMVVSDVVRLLSQAIFAALLFSGQAALWSMMVLQAVHGTASAFYRPASSGLLAQLLPRELRQRGTSLMYSTSSAAQIIGPVLAGVLLAASSPAWAFAVDAMSFGVSALLLLRVRPPPRNASAGNHFWEDLATGWHEVVSRTWLWSWISDFALFQFVILSSFLVLGPVVSADSLGTTAWAIISTCVGVGSLVGSGVAVRWHPSRPLVAVGFTVLLAPPILVALAFTAPVAILAALGFVFGVAITFADVVWDSTVQNNVPEEVLSRVVSYDWLGSSFLRPIGLALVGPIAAGVGVRNTLLGASAIFTVATAALLLRGDARSLPAFPDTTLEPPPKHLDEVVS